MLHANPLVVSLSARLLLSLYRKTIGLHCVGEYDLLQTDPTLELLFNNVNAFLDKATGAQVRMLQNLVACAVELVKVLAYLLSCASLSARHGDKRQLVTSQVLQKLLTAF